MINSFHIREADFESFCRFLPELFCGTPPTLADEAQRFVGECNFQVYVDVKQKLFGFICPE